MANSDKSKIPLRGIAKLFTHLDPGVRSKLESAFGEAEDLIDYHNRSVVEQQDKRVLSSVIAAPQITIDQNNLGFDVNWPRLEDRRVSFYEVQVSLDSIFAAPESYTVVDTSLSVEGVTNTTYVRVRGVRADGTCGPWSDTASVVPSGFNGPIVYSRDITDVPSFYVDGSYGVWNPIQRIVITPQRTNGGIMMFGSIGAEGLSGDFVLSVNDTPVQTFTVTASAPLQAVGGVAFGPCFVSHGNFYFSTTQSHNPETATDQGGGGSRGTHTGWSDLANATGAIETVGSAALETDGASYEVSGLSRGQTTSSDKIRLSNFGFTIPTSYTIVGIKLEIACAYEMLGNTSPTTSYPLMKSMVLVDGGVARTTSQVTDVQWPGPDHVPFGETITTETYGGATDLWGETSSYWTPSKINASNFGVEIIAKFRYSTSSGAGKTQDDKVFILGALMTVYATKSSQVAEVKLTSTNFGWTGTELLNCTMNAIEFGE